MSTARPGRAGRAAGVDARDQIRQQASAFCSAPAESSDPEAAASVAALDWFAKRIRGGQLNYLAHTEFVQQFGVDPYTPGASS